MTQQDAKESLSARLWRKRMSILVWGGSFLACFLLWVAIVEYAESPGAEWTVTAVIGGMLLQVAWFVGFRLTNKDAYRKQVEAGKILPPEDIARIEAVRLKPPKKWRLSPETWLDPKQAGKPDPGYGRSVNWAPRFLQGPLSFLWILLILMTPYVWIPLLDPLWAAAGGLAAYILPYFVSFLVAAFVSAWLDQRLRRQVWAEIRATDKSGDPRR